MNFKARIKSIEEKLSMHIKGIEFEELVKPGYKHKGKPYGSYDEMVEALKVIDLPPWLDYWQIIKLLENGLITYESPEGQELRKQTVCQMTEMM